MKALSKMTIYEKAICLFKLLPEDTVNFIISVRWLAEKIAAGETVVHRKKHSRERVEEWPDVARGMCGIFAEHQQEIVGNATLFAHYLFANDMASLTLYCLEDRIAHPDWDQSNFYFAAKLLFF